MMRKVWVVVCVAACGSPSSSVTPPGEIIGRVEISAGVPAAGCLVLVEGAPISAKCDENGAFDLRNMPPGRWDLRIDLDDKTTTLPARRIAAGANSNFVSDLGAVEISQPGSVGGHVTGDPATLAISYVAISSIGAVTAPNAGGGYLLDNVSPGAHDVILITPSGALDVAPVTVMPKNTTIGVNFDLALAKATGVDVHGVSARGDGTSDGLTIELVSALDGKSLQSVNPDGGGTFVFPNTTPGAYLVRASDGNNPAKAIIPSIVVSNADVTLGSALIIPAGSDLDGDGIPDSQDDDIDGDGVPNDQDAFPYDPAETKDTDGDGIGDRADLQSNGGANVDNKVPTPDTDGDGLLDFEDNCPTIPNPGQSDVDHDGVGDACDTCPTLPNPDQTGLCVQCLTNAQCGNDICDSGRCVPCTMTSQCSNGETCDTGLGICVACVTNSDCGDATKACIEGVCTPKCTDDTTCPGGFCQTGVCVQCRGTADCPLNEYCDENVCSAKCTSSGQCAGNRTCDLASGTCVTPCSGTCTSGEKCIGNVCRSACDGSSPCPSGLACDDATGACKPECQSNVDCAGTPHTTCNAGACVPDGTCTFDADCPSSDLCTAGVCLPRPTTFDMGQGFECTTACDCRQGEVCDTTGGHCVNDAIAFGDGVNREMTPTFFAQAGATGSGASPNAPGDPAIALAQVASGATKIVALRGGDTITLAAPLAITEGDVAVLGGFEVCAANRWVRDLSLQTTISAPTTGVISVGGTLNAPTPHVAFENLALATTDSTARARAYMLDASFAPALAVSHVTANHPMIHNGGGQEYGGVFCASCTGVSIDHVNVFTASSDASAYFFGVNLPSGSGKLDHIHIGGVAEAHSTHAISVTNTSGPVTITNAQIDASQTGGGGGITVATCGADSTTNAPFPVTIASSTVGFDTRSAAVDEAWIGITVLGCGAANVHDNAIDGSSAGINAGSQRTGVAFQDSSGTLANTHVVFPVQTAGGLMVGFSITGPHGTIAMTNDSTAGGTMPNADLIAVGNLTAGVLAISNGSFTHNSGTSVEGLYVAGSANGGNPAIVMTDTAIAVHGTAIGNSDGAYLTASSARFERDIITDDNDNNITAIYLSSASALELYDSFLYTTPDQNGNAVALDVLAGSTLLAVGDTIDGGGSPSSNVTEGIRCVASVATVRSSLIGGGSGATHKMLSDADSGDHSCFKPAGWDHDYFWYARPAVGESPNDLASTVATAAVGTKDASGNLINDTVSCYDSAFVSPDFHITSTSPCVDLGVAGTRKDGSAIAKDITNGTRVKGAAADVGAFEKQ